MEPINVAIIYYSATGTIRTLAEAAAEGAGKAGATVRLAKVAETAPQSAVDSRPEWAEHLAATAATPLATHDDLTWADVLLFGAPTRFGNPASQLRAFLETTGPLWFQGLLADKVYSAFTASNTAHGGQESTILALANTFYHWGDILGAARLHRPGPVPVRESLRHLARRRRRRAGRGGPGGGAAPGPALRRGRRRAEGRTRGAGQPEHPGPLTRR